MKRERDDAGSQCIALPTHLLPREILGVISAQVYEPWFMDLRAFLRWHQCCRANWRDYCEKDQAALHSVLTQKHVRQCIPSPTTRHIDAAWNCARLKRAVMQASLLSVIERELQTLPARMDIDDLGSGGFSCMGISKSVVLNKMVDFADYTNEHAVTVLTWCRLYIELRYGWCMQLVEYLPSGASAIERWPWKARKIAKTGLHLAFTDRVEIPKAPDMFQVMQYP